MHNEQVAKSVDLLWDGWLNSVKSLQKVQDDVEKKTLQAFTYQKELLESTASALSSIEEESKKTSKEWQEKVQNSLNGMSNLEQVSQWFVNVQEITNKAQELAWKPSNAILDLVSNSQNQWEATVKKALDLQKQERIETLTKIEDLTNQLKETHKKLLAVNE